MRRAAPRRTLEGEEAAVAAREQREEVTRGKEAWWIERTVPRTQWRRRERQGTPSKFWHAKHVAHAFDMLTVLDQAHVPVVLATKPRELSSKEVLPQHGSPIRGARLDTTVAADGG